MIGSAFLDEESEFFFRALAGKFVGLWAQLMKISFFPRVASSQDEERRITDVNFSRF